MSPKFEAGGEECPFCQGRNLRQFEAGSLESRRDGRLVSIVECRDCVVAWQWPLRRTVDESVTHYQKRYSHAEDGDCTYFRKENRESAALKQLAFVSALTTPSQRRLLDVGAGLAHFVNVAADNGFDAIGVEPSYQVSQGFQPRNASLLPGSVNDLPADQLFDVITLWDVIEHVEKPLEIIQQSIAHLRPGGWLVLETGNYQSTSRIMSGDSWWAYHVEHRWYFTPSSLELTMKHAGLENFRHGQVGAPPGQVCQPYSGPDRVELLKKVVKRPWTIGRELNQYNQLKQAAHDWQPWVAVSVMIVAGQKRS